MNKNKVIRDLIDRKWEEFVIHITAAIQQLDDVHVDVLAMKVTEDYIGYEKQIQNQQKLLERQKGVK